MRDSVLLLPNLFVIGAGKAGTTSLHRYLSAHPEISMSSVKEPMLFAGQGYEARLHGYAELLDAGVAIRGDSSSTYSQYPRWASIPERIHAHVPDARFIYLVRDPIRRALAHYRQHVHDLKEGRSVAEAFADYERPDSLYLSPSRYATQLERYLARFPASRILVVDQERLASDRAATMRLVFEFVGVDPDFTSGTFDELSNTRSQLRRRTGLGSVLSRTGALATARRLRLPGPIRSRLRSAVSRPIEAPELPADLQAEIAAMLGDEVDRLRAHTGLGFDGWEI